MSIKYLKSIQVPPERWAYLTRKPLINPILDSLAKARKARCYIDASMYFYQAARRFRKGDKWFYLDVPRGFNAEEALLKEEPDEYWKNEYDGHPMIRHWT